MTLCVDRCTGGTVEWLGRPALPPVCEPCYYSIVHMPTQYSYVGPADIKESTVGHSAGVTICTTKDLSAWARQQDEWDCETLTVTFVVLPDRTLRVAPRRSEHVACALGGSVAAAGELTLCLKPKLMVVGATNQSTGYCPEPGCWDAARSTLMALEIPCPSELTSCYTFRMCPGCWERNLIKEDWFVCDLCGHDLPHEWNFDESTRVARNA